MKTSSLSNAASSGGGDIIYPSLNIEDATFSPQPSACIKQRSPEQFRDKAASFQNTKCQRCSLSDRVHLKQQEYSRDDMCTDESCKERYLGCPECDAIEIPNRVYTQDEPVPSAVYQPQYARACRSTSPSVDLEPPRPSMTSQHSRQSSQISQFPDTSSRAPRSPRNHHSHARKISPTYHQNPQDENVYIPTSPKSASTVSSINYNSRRNRATPTSNPRSVPSHTNTGSGDSWSSITGQSQKPIVSHDHHNGSHKERRSEHLSSQHSTGGSQCRGKSSGPAPVPKPNTTDVEKYEIVNGRHERTYYEDRDDENAFAVLMRIHVLAPLALFLCFYALFLSVFLAFIFPLRFCPPSDFFSSRVGFRGQVSRTLGPVYCFSMRVVYASETSSRYIRIFGDRDVESSGGNVATRRPSTMKHATASTNTSPGTISNSTSSSSQLEMTPNMIMFQDSIYELEYPSMLLLAGIIFPFLTLPFIIFAWVAACFWMFSIILSDFDDGRAFVLALRDSWVRMVRSLISLKRCT